MPDFYLEDLQKLNEHGIEAFLLHTPGHSPGSISIITSEKECICGDLFENIKKPQINTMVDDAADVQNSVNKVLKYDIQSFYPGHGDVFDINQLIL